MDNTETFEKLNDYTLSVSTAFSIHSSTDPMLRRIFNFNARRVTEIYSMWYGAGVSSSMQSQNFNDFESQDEIRLMHKKLIELNGHPPALDGLLKPLRKSNLKPQEH